MGIFKLDIRNFPNGMTVRTIPCSPTADSGPAFTSLVIYGRMWGMFKQLGLVTSHTTLRLMVAEETSETTVPPLYLLSLSHQFVAYHSNSDYWKNPNFFYTVHHYKHIVRSSIVSIH